MCFLITIIIKNAIAILGVAIFLKKIF